MKKFIIPILLFVLFNSTVHSQDSTPTDGPRWFNLSSGIITYSVTGREQGSEVLYFDRWGMRQSKFSETVKPKFGFQRITTITLKDWIFLMDLDKKIVKKSKNSAWENLLAAHPGDNPVFQEEFMRSVHGEKIGTAELLGRPCEVWLVQRIGTTYWLWQGVPLKIIIEAGTEKTTFTAEKIEENVPLSDDLFLVPEGFIYIEGDLNEIMISAIGPRNENV